MAQKIHRKKKKTKVDPDGIAFIQSTFNNTIVTLADKYGNAISWSSAGALGFKGSKKNTPFVKTMLLMPQNVNALIYIIFHFLECIRL